MTVNVEERLNLVRKIPNEFGEPMVLTPLIRDTFTAFADPAIWLLLLALSRQSGKSTLAQLLAISELLCVPHSHVLMVAAAERQARAIFERKLKGPLERALSASLRKELGATFTKNGVEMRHFGSTLEVLPANEATTTGRSVSLLLIDEARDVPDAVFTALAPSILAANGRMVICSSAGAPRGFFYRLLQLQDERIWKHVSAVNANPRADQSLIGQMRNWLRLVDPTAASRELDNVFADVEEALVPARLIDASVDPELGELPTSDLSAWAFVDLSRRRDKTTVAVVVRDEPRRPEASDHLVLASLRVWNPADEPTGETPFEEVREHLRQLRDRFPNLEKILVDEGAEGGSVLPFCRADSRLSLLVEGFIGSVASNQRLWGALIARLNARTLSIPDDASLLGELRSLKRQEFAFGSGFRVTDSSRRWHRDVSLALAGACMAAGDLDATPLMLVSHEPGSAWMEHVARAPLPPPADVEDDGEVIEASLEEMQARDDFQLWEPAQPPDLIPRAIRRRQFHDDLQQIATKEGWFPDREVTR